MNLMTVALWGGFIAGVLALIALDLFVHRSKHELPSVASALLWTAFWIVLSACFGIGVWVCSGGNAAVQFFTAYLLEKSLSVDNLFLFLLLFGRFKVPPEERHRVLTWGILGAIVLRAALILAGIELIHLFEPVIYAFAALLLWTGLHALFGRTSQPSEVHDSWVVRLVSRHLPVAPRYEGGRFFTREAGRRVGTLLLLVLVLIEASDVMFAFDSVPAAFGVTTDPFLVFSSNILAVLGLRALYFAVAATLRRLRYLQRGLGILLVAVAAKMIVGEFVAIAPVWTLGLTAVIVAGTVVASLWADRRSARSSG